MYDISSTFSVPSNKHSFIRTDFALQTLVYLENFGDFARGAASANIANQIAVIRIPCQRFIEFHFPVSCVTWGLRDEI